MKRFHITNIASGQQFERVGESLGDPHPMWGKPAWVETILNDDGTQTQVPHVAEFSVVEEDMTQELADKAAKAAARQARRDRLKTANPKAGGANTVANIIQDLLDEINGV